MRLNAYAKINWTLDILSRYENGYHEMDMIMQSISLCDSIILKPFNGLGLSITGDVSVPNNADNLVIKAAKALLPYTDGFKGVHITLEKHIPVGAGLGGGSADCAAVLLGLNRLWHINLSKEELASIAASLGADVPFFLYGGLAQSQGIGEKLTLHSCKYNYPLIIIKPEAPLITKKVFAAFQLEQKENKPDTTSALRAIQTNDLMLMRQSLGNVLTPVSCFLCPEITNSLHALVRHGATISFMTGSGNAVVGIFKSTQSRDNALAALECNHLCYAAKTQNRSIEMFP